MQRAGLQQQRRMHPRWQRAGARMPGHICWRGGWSAPAMDGALIGFRLLVAGAIAAIVTGIAAPGIFLTASAHSSRRTRLERSVRESTNVDPRT